MSVIASSYLMRRRIYRMERKRGWRDRCNRLNIRVKEGKEKKEKLRKEEHNERKEGRSDRKE